MKKRLTHNECLVLYAKYLHCHIPITEFCQDNDIPYLEFVDWVNKWDDKHGETIVDTCMEQPEYGNSSQTTIRPSRAENMFKEIVVQHNTRQYRSNRKFPNGAGVYTELDTPQPNTIIRQASLTFPSGVILDFQEATIKSLILTVVLYEEFDTWAGK